MKFYLLDENKQPYEVSLEESYKLYDDPEMKIVQQDKLDNGKFVSTVFLGWDLNVSPHHKPVLFETMIFNDVESRADICMNRYTSYEEALAGHQRALEIANKTN